MPATAPFFDALSVGDAAPPLVVDKLTRTNFVRYAGASGDFNPIHIDEAFAKQVGLPGRILHGLWTMAQVARAVTDAAGGPEKLERLSVQFRGMGQLGEEIAVQGTVTGLDGGTATIEAEAIQSGASIIRNAVAEVTV